MGGRRGRSDRAERQRSARPRLLEQLVVRPGEAAGVSRRDPGWTGGPDLADLTHDELEAHAKDRLARGTEALADAQELLWASDRYALLVVFQAMDAAGKDSAIEHVMSGVNPQGVHVVSFKKPSSEELDHDFLWRTAKALPERGRIGIFNRSHYEEVVALRVHPEWLDAQRLPPGPRDEAFWQERYEDINAFERHLDRNGTKIVKFFLHVSKAEQKERFLARLDSPARSGSSTPPTSKSGRGGTTTWTPSRPHSRRPRRRGRRGTWCPPTTSCDAGSSRADPRGDRQFTRSSLAQRHGCRARCQRGGAQEARGRDVSDDRAPPEQLLRTNHPGAWFKEHARMLTQASVLFVGNELCW